VRCEVCRADRCERARLLGEWKPAGGVSLIFRLFCPSPDFSGCPAFLTAAPQGTYTCNPLIGRDIIGMFRGRYHPVPTVTGLRSLLRRCSELSRTQDRNRGCVPVIRNDGGRLFFSR
jgi:hypothetical protein